MTPVVVSSMLATTLPTSAGPLGGGEARGPAADLLVDVLEPVQGDEDHGADEVGAVVHRDVRLVLQGRGDVPVVARLVLALDGVDGDVEVVDQAGRDVVLGRERVGGDQHEVGAAGLEGPGQVGRLGRHVQAGRHPEAGQRLLDLEPLADRAEHGHVPLRPEDPLVADAGQGQILHVTRNHGRQE